MKKNKQKNGFTSIQILAVIGVLAIVVAVVVFIVTRPNESSEVSNEETFVSDAKSYIDLVRNDTDDLPTVPNGEKIIKLSELALNDDQNKSIYGNSWVDDNSYIVIRNTGSKEQPEYTYYIALEDEQGYCIELTEESALSSSLLKNNGCNIEVPIFPDDIPVTPEEAFVIENGVITDYDISYGTEVNIPETINGMTVTEIGDYAFEEYSITKLVLPDTITRIGVCAFINSIELKKVIIPDSVTFIGNGAFAYAPIEQLKLGASIETIDDYGFELTTATSLKLPETLTYIGRSAFSHVVLEELELPSNLVTIGDSAFNRSLLTSLTLPETVETIGEGSFYNSNLTTLTIPSSVQSIGSNAFGSSELESVTIKGKGTSDCFTTGEGKFTSIGEETVFGWRDEENIICEQ